MQVARALIRNFRKIRHAELDFTDSLGKVRDLCVLVGPNGAGKTSVLDALATAIGLQSELPYRRAGYTLRPLEIIGKYAREARIECEIRFSDEELEMTERIARLAGHPWRVPGARSVELEWVYPDPGGRHGHGVVRCAPYDAWTQLKGRVWAARLLRTSEVGWSVFEKLGAVFTFDQSRSGMAKTINRQILSIIENRDVEEDAVTQDAMKILLNLAVKSKFPEAPGVRAIDEFKLIQEHFAALCAPRRMLEVRRDETGNLDLFFDDGEQQYPSAGLSGGERQLLLFLVRMISEHIYRSLVLIDELELHLHPFWQRHLIHRLPATFSTNQFIVTTHSPYLRDIAPRGAVIDMGDLGDGEAQDG